MSYVICVMSYVIWRCHTSFDDVIRHLTMSYVIFFLSLTHAESTSHKRHLCDTYEADSTCVRGCACICVCHTDGVLRGASTWSSREFTWFYKTRSGDYWILLVLAIHNSRRHYFTSFKNLVVQFFFLFVPLYWVQKPLTICSSHLYMIMSPLYESCHVWMRHVTYECVMSRMNESCHIWMSHVTYEWVMSRISESCHIWMSHVTYESCHIAKCHTNLIYINKMSHVTYDVMDKSCSMQHISATVNID